MNKIIGLHEAIDLLWGTISRSNIDTNAALPYFFLIGAGVSSPEIKTAKEIIKECKELIQSMYGQETFQRIEVESQTLESNSMRNYSFWFEKAYENMIERKNYLEDMIHKSKISSANLLLAQILISRKISSTIITTNFDDKLYQALTLFGEHDIFVADNVIDNKGVSPFSNIIQIIHLHGTYHLYDCCNLEPEIKNVSRDRSIMSASNVLSDFLRYKSPIIIGYSGWEKDVVMTQLEERLKLPLPYNLIWFCYSRKDYNNLPNWLTGHPNTCFVLPYESDLKVNESLDTSSFIDERHYKGLTAVQVFSSIISRFNIEIPTIFTNPFKYYSQIINNYIPQNEDIFHLKRWVERMKFIEKSVTGTELIITNLESATVKRDYKEIITCISQLSNESLLSQNDIIYLFFDVIFKVLFDDNEININFEYDLCDILIVFMQNKIDFFIENESLEKATFFLCSYVYRSKLSEERKAKLYYKIEDIIREDNKYEKMEVIVYCFQVILMDKKEDVNTITRIIREKGMRHVAQPQIAYLVMNSLLSYYYNSNNIQEKNIFLEDIKKIVDIHSDDYIIITKWYDVKINIIDNTDDINSKLTEYDKLLQIVTNSAFDCISQIIRIYLAKICFESSNIKRISIYEECIKYESKIFDLNDDEITLEYMYILDCIIDIYIEDSDKRGVLSLFSKIEKYYDTLVSPSKEIKKVFIEIINKFMSENEFNNEKERLLFKIIMMCKVYASDIDFREYILKALNDLYDITSKENITLILADFITFKDMVLTENYINYAYEEYQKGNLVEAENLFYERYYIEKSFYGNDYIYSLEEINLAYMKRKGKTKKVSENILDLLRETEAFKENAFRCINLALCYIDGNECTPSWENAIDTIKKITYDIQDAFLWWDDENEVGKEEKHLVILLLYLAGLVSEEQLYISCDEIKSICKKAYNLPSNIEELFDKKSKEFTLLNT
jgi:hypothetical protein